jgi:hypothetical protein
MSMKSSADPSSTQPPRPRSSQEAEVENIVRALRPHGVLTRARLVELCGAAHWTDAGFGQALARAVATGRIRRLGHDLYETTEPSADDHDPTPRARA